MPGQLKYPDLLKISWVILSYPLADCFKLPIYKLGCQIVKAFKNLES